MELSKLLVSNLNISEDEYSYKGLFTLSSDGVSIQVDLSELDGAKKIEEIKSIFALEEAHETIRKHIMEMVMEQASISTQIKEGENFFEDKNSN